jgi:hypothetical protein
MYGQLGVKSMIHYNFNITLFLNKIFCEALIELLKLVTDSLNFYACIKILQYLQT